MSLTASIPLPVQCPPDPFLTNEYLQALFNEFNTSISTSVPQSSIFASLVNGVRQAYISNALGQQQELRDQSAQYEQRLDDMAARQKAELSKAFRQYQDSMVLPEEHTHGQKVLESLLMLQEATKRSEKDMAQLSDTAEHITERFFQVTSHLKDQALHVVEQQRELNVKSEESVRQQGMVNLQHEKRLNTILEHQKELKLHAEQLAQSLSAMVKQQECRLQHAEDTHKAGLDMIVNSHNTAASVDILYVTTSQNPLRDTVSWILHETPDWVSKCQFKVFRHAGINTIKIGVGQHAKPHRISLRLGNTDFSDQWSERLHFYAFKDKQPNTERIYVGDSAEGGKYRCIILKGEDPSGKVGIWNEKFVFWAPI